MGPVVARAYCCGQLLVGKVNTQDRTCCVAFEGRVFEAMRYEVLVVERGRVEWMTCRNGYVPPSAMPGGMTLQSNKIYPVRVHINGSLIPGQLIKGERCCRIPYEKHELMFREYEVLTLRCSEDKRPGPSRRMGPTDEEWEEFVLPKSCHQPDIRRLRNGDYTVPPSRRVCLPPSDSSEGGDSLDSGNGFNPPVLDAGDSEPGPVLAVGDSEPGSILAAGDCVPGPSHQIESLVTRPSDCDDSPSPSQGPRPRL
ncbi:CSON007100 protein [Gryllus bimaculatus]|nr:CSON007100 protein [Gryllus bimaculatus]